LELNAPARVNKTVTDNIGKKLAPTANQTEHNSSITPAYDTNPLNEKVLTKDQKYTIRDINNLLKEIQRVSTSINDNKKKGLWANIDHGKGNNVILIKGKRGVGKTSCLLTLIEGWRNSNKTEDTSDLWKGMSSVVRSLQPLDFDSIPPELPIFSWIIQAFNPLVNHISQKKHNCCETKGSIQQIYQELQRTVTVGWTTGLLARKSEKDLDDFFLWQAEQQFEWQKLKRKWSQFIDLILQLLERSNKLPQNGLIVLPIDDLDMQVNRTRELLLILRMLFHPRLVYILTGDEENTDRALSTSFYREFTQNTVFNDSGLLDKVIEQSEILGQSLRQKTIPTSQVFHIEGIHIKKVMRWEPPYFGKNYSDTKPLYFGEIIQKISKSWVEDSDQNKLTNLFDKSPHDIDHFIFRDLQRFFDQWRNNEDENTYIYAITEFLRIILENPSEESLFVGHMNNIDNEQIYITGKPGIGTFRPRKVSSKKIDNTGISIYWSNNFEFSRMFRNEFGDGFVYDAASAEYLLALDIEQQFKDQVEIDHRLRFVEPSLGIIWTETSDHIVPWPIVGPTPKSPSDWVNLYSDWNAFLNDNNIDLNNLSSDDELFFAWVSFLFKVNGQSVPPDDSVFQALVREENQNLEGFDNLAVFGHSKMGFSNSVRRGKNSVMGEIMKLFEQSELDVGKIDVGKIGQAWERLALKPNKPIKNYSLDKLTFLAYESESKEDQ